MRRIALAILLAALAAPSLADPLLHPGHVLGNGTSSERSAQDAPLIDVVNQSGSGVAVVYAPITADGFIGQDAVISNASATLASASRACTSSDVGTSKVVEIAGGGSASGDAPLHTYVASCSGSNYVLHDVSANSGVLTNTQWSIATDQSSALNSFAAAHTNTHIILPCGVIGLDAASVTLQAQWLDGCGAASPVGGAAALLTTGTIFAVTSSSSSQPAFIIKRSVRLSNFNMFWPGQYGVTAAPVVYGPAFSDVAGTGYVSWSMDHVAIVNAYDVVYQASTTPISAIDWNNVRAYGIHRGIYEQGISEAFTMVNVAFNPDIAPGISATGYGAAGNLKAYTAASGVFFNGVGSGTSGNPCESSHPVALKATNLEVAGYNTVFSLVGARWRESNIVGGDFNGIKQFINADAGSLISGVSVTGSFFAVTDTASTLPLIDYEGQCTDNDPGALAFTGNSIGTQLGGVLYTNSGATAGNMKRLAFSGNKVTAFITAPSAPTYAFTLNDNTMKAAISGNEINSATNSANGSGFNIINAVGAALSDNVMNGFYEGFDLTSYSSGKITITGNSVTASGDASLKGSVTTATIVGQNFFDAPEFSVASVTGACSSSVLVAARLQSGFASGNFKAGTCVSSTYILNFSETAAHGWSCNAIDTSTPADTLTQTGWTTATATLTGTTANTDLMAFTCQSW